MNDDLFDALDEKDAAHLTAHGWTEIVYAGVRSFVSPDKRFTGDLAAALAEQKWREKDA